MDPDVGDLPVGDVLVEDGTIVAVAPSVEASDCDVVDAAGTVVLPGLIDAHRHLWYSALQGTGMDHALGDLGEPVFGVGRRYTAEDLYATTRAGIAWALDNGVTTVWHECQMVHSTEHALASIRAHQELPGRARFVVDTGDWERARQLRETVLSSDDARLTMAIAVNEPHGTTDVARGTFGAVRELGLPMQVNGGFPLGAAPTRGVQFLADLGLIGPDMNFVHCNTTSEDEFALLREAGATVTSCPMTEILVGLGLAALGRMRKCGLEPAIGTDALCAGSGDMLENARTGLILARAFSEGELYARDSRPVETVADLGFTARDALAGVTISAAKACGLADRTGSLTPGKAADIILLRSAGFGLGPLNDPLPTVVCSANGSNVDTVLVDGQIVKRGGTIVGFDAPAIRAALLATQERLAAEVAVAT
jgi:cytosine/adenosine deaminase-related metal-dependent hydrolase